MSRRVALVVPRFAPSLVGGMERLTRGLADQMLQRGWQVELWTSCALDHHSYKNVLPPGWADLDGLRVHRFPVEWVDPERHRHLERQLSTTGALPPDEQLDWLLSGPHSPTLYAHIHARAKMFERLICLPYASTISQLAAWAAPSRVLFIPCLHDEPYATLWPLQALLNEVWGVAFNSPEEATLAARELRIEPQRQRVIGVGVDPAPPTSHREPRGDTLLYCGRLEAGKNVSLLYEFVQRLHDEGHPIRLIVAGDGPLPPPPHPAFEHRGWISDSAQAALYAAALALCQPSLHESFSLTIMESWQAARPVLVHGRCAVTQGHVERASGGLWFHNYEEFRAAVLWLQANPTQAARLGQNGSRYVTANYEWSHVMGRLERYLDQHLIAI